MGVYIPNMEKPKDCSHCPCESDTACQLLDSELGGTPLEGIRPDCPLIEIDDTVWENEKYKLIRMTQEARINKAMAERRAE